MTEASYTAWDDKQYVWPPPDGWYEAADGKWWPEGYGPPQAKEETPSADVAERPVHVEDPAVDEAHIADPQIADAHVGAEHKSQDEIASLADAANQRITTSAAGQSLAEAGSDVDGGWLTDTPAALDNDQQELEPSVEHAEAGAVDQDAALTDIFDRTDDAMAKAAEAVANVPGVDSGVGDFAEHRNGAVPTVDGMADTGDVADAVDAAIVDNSGSVTDSAREALNEQAETIAGSDSFDASTSAATPAFGTGLMPPMADRPAPAPENGQPTSFDPPQTAGHQDSVDLSPPDAGFEGLKAAPHATAPPLYDAATDQQAMLAGQDKGSSRGLLFAILGVLLLVGIGAALFFALGGDEDSDAVGEDSVVTGPGSVNEPHPRATGVVVFYPDDGVEQRWIVEVLEPVRDATDELGTTDGTEIYAATRIRVSNESGIDGASVEDLRFNVVDGSNNVIIRTEHNCPASADDLDYQASVAIESSVEGTVCWAVPAGDLTGLKLGIESSKVQGRVHIQLQ